MKPHRTRSHAQLGGVHPALLALGVLVLIVVIAIVWIVGIRNGAVSRDESVKASWADVEAQYQRRYDLIGNLVATVEGAADFERGTLTAVTDARASVGRVRIELGEGGAAALDDPAAMQRFMAAQSQLGATLKSLFAVSESYPQLTATRNFADLQHQLEGTENRISVAREDYNDAVRGYNSFIRKIPNKLFLDVEEYPRRTPFVATTPAATEVPVVDFSPDG